MRVTWLIAGLVFTVAVSAAGYQRGSNWKAFRYPGTRLMANLAQPDALILTTSLAQLPSDLLKVPLARDVLTEDLVFYYEQHENQLGLKGAIKRIAYEHELDWTDRILTTVLDEPAELALWRDGKGALRHFAIVMRRNALAKVIQEAATVALKDRQLTLAAEIESGDGKAQVLALEINPRQTLLLITQGDRLVVLSDPGLLFDSDSKVVPAARAAVADWLNSEGALARHFALDKARLAQTDGSTAQPRHTLAVSARALALGYGTFLPGFKGLRFEFGESWSTHVWVDPKNLPTTGLGDAELWRAAPANPSACVLLPVDWQAARQVVNQADKKPLLPNSPLLAGIDGAALACWYKDSNLYSPLFISRHGKKLADRTAALQALTHWALTGTGATAPSVAEVGGVTASAQDKKSAQKNSAAPKTPAAKTPSDTMIWRTERADGQDAKVKQAAVAAHGAYVMFSPDTALVELALDTLARKNPSVADQMPVSNATLALITPRPLAAMAEQESFAALSSPGDANLLAAAQTHLPARMKALAAYPPYRLELAAKGKPQSGWQRVQWLTPEENN